MKLKKRLMSDFFKTEYVNFSSYDNIRKIASLVDGQKNAARKVLWFAQEKNLRKELKVSQLDSKVAEFTEYLHGGMSGVIINLAQDFAGTNNVNLLMPEGNFGTRLVNEPSAPRYIYTYGSKDFFELFNKEDTPILDHQYFEGHQIEPKFFVPKLPILLINGSSGISSGYAQKILPRNPEEIKSYIKYRLSHPDAPKKPFKNMPYYRGFKGEIKQGEDSNQFEFYGVFTRKANKVYITELPIGYTLKSYLKVLDKLEDEKKIVTYKDYSDDDFNFEVQFNRKFLDSLSDEQLINLLKLKKRDSENYTVMNENMKVEVFDNISQIMDRYIDVKLKYTEKRRLHNIEKLTNDIKFLVSKYIFIQKVTNDEIVINKRPTADIENDLRSIDKIIPIDNSYDYLLNLSIKSLTKERMESLLKQIKEEKEKLDFMKSTTAEKMWLSEL